MAACDARHLGASLSARISYGENFKPVHWETYSYSVRKWSSRWPGCLNSLKNSGEDLSVLDTLLVLIFVYSELTRSKQIGFAFCPSPKLFFYLKGSSFSLAFNIINLAHKTSPLESVWWITPDLIPAHLSIKYYQVLFTCLVWCWDPWHKDEWGLVFIP